MRWRVMLATCGSVTLFSLMATASDKPPDAYVKQMWDMNDAAIMLQDDIEARNWSSVRTDVAKIKTLLKATQVCTTFGVQFEVGGDGDVEQLEERLLLRGLRHTDKLFSDEALERLLARPQGPTTEDGLRYAMYMATEFMYQQLLGNNAAAIYDPRTGLRFMNDLATYEIFWHFLYLTVFHGVELTADGEMTKKGDRVTPELFLKLLAEIGRAHV